MTSGSSSNVSQPYQHKVFERLIALHFKMINSSAAAVVPLHSGQGRHQPVESLIDVQDDHGARHLLVFKAKSTDWDKIAEHRITANLRFHARQLFRAYDSLMDLIDNGGADSLQAALVYQRRPSDPERARLIEGMLDRQGLLALFFDELPEMRRRDGQVKDRITDLILELSINPLPMQTLPFEDFERLIAELLRRLGYQVDLTRASKDGGVDIYASRLEPMGARVLYYVQCKRYAPPNKVGLPPVKELYGTVFARHATGGLLVTSSFFTSGALKFQKSVPHQLTLNDYNDVNRWIAETTPLGGENLRDADSPARISVVRTSMGREPMQDSRKGFKR